MPTISNTPTVNVAVPVPTPVQQQPKTQQPVSFGLENDTTPVSPAVPNVPRQRRTLQAVIMPWHPPPKQMKRLPKRVIRFNTHEDMKAFHKQFHTQQKGDKQNSAVYADMIQEQGKENHADVIRGDIMTQQEKESSPWEANYSHHTNLEPGQFAVMPDTYHPNDTESYPAISMIQRSLHNPDRIFWWVKSHKNIAARNRQLRALVSEGAVHIKDGST